MKVRAGERIGRLGRLRVGCVVVVFDATRERLLLTRRADNGRWCLPGGGMDAGESIAEACLRELEEETGLRGQIARLIGVYSSPDWLLEYSDGNRCQPVTLSFEVEMAEGALRVTDETTEYGYFTAEEVARMDVVEHHRERIADAFTRSAEPFVR